MIIEVEGDILLTKANAIAHGVAANDPMNQGLAKSLHEWMPSMHKDFHHWCHQQHPKPGAAWVWTASNGMRIVNLLTQDGGYGHGAHPEKASSKNVRNSLKVLRKLVEDEKLASVALPRLATGVGGLDWDEVKPIIDQQLGDLDIPVYVYTKYVKDQQAKEA